MTSTEFSEKYVSRFWSKVDKNGTEPAHVPGIGACWNWAGSKNPGGYGNFKLGEKRVNTHRVSWIFHNGPIPANLFVLHRCDNPSCVRPDHLFLGSQLDNAADCRSKGRQPSFDAKSQIMLKVAARGPSHGLKKHPERAARGESNGTSKLTGEQVEDIRRIYASGDQNQKQLASRFGIVPGTVSKIVRFEMWTHIKMTARTVSTPLSPLPHPN